MACKVVELDLHAGPSALAGGRLRADAERDAAETTVRSTFTDFPFYLHLLTVGRRFNRVQLEGYLVIKLV